MKNAIRLLFVFCFALSAISGERSVCLSDLNCGEYTEYSHGYERLDIVSGAVDETDIMSMLSATQLWNERFDGLRVFYAYSNRVNGSVRVRGKKVNIMIAVTDEKISVGSPLLKGSY